MSIRAGNSLFPMFRLNKAFCPLVQPGGFYLTIFTKFAIFYLRDLPLAQFKLETSQQILGAGKFFLCSHTPTIRRRVLSVTGKSPVAGKT